MITMAEKVAILFGVSTTTLLCGYAVLKPKIQKIVQDNDIVNRRNEIIKQKTVKVLYSTMSFFYLQQYSKTVESFLLFKEILDVAKPKIVALQISEKEYISQYQPVIRNPSFQDAIRKVEYLSKTNSQELLTMQELDFQAGLENLYAIDFCMKNNCKIVYADEPKSYFQEIYDAKIKLRQEIIETPEYAMRDIQKSPQQIYDEVFINKRSEIYVEKLMSEMTPTFSLLPDVPYKVIVGLVKPELSQTLSQMWKQQFLSVYGHQIIEDDMINQFATIEESSRTEIQSVDILQKIFKDLNLSQQYPDYSSVDYWNNKYKRSVEPFEWMQHYQALREHIFEILKGRFEVALVLYVGCGTSQLGQLMLKDGILKIKCADFSDTLIRNVQHPTIQYILQDCCQKFEFGDQSLDLIIDKGTLDCIFCGEGFFQRILIYLKECQRCLVRTGTLMILSSGHPDTRIMYLKPFNIKVIELRKTKIDQFDDNENHYLYLCTQK